MLLSNTLVYDNQLRAGSEDVARAQLCMPLWKPPLFETVDGCHSKKINWLDQAVSPHRKVVFINTDKVC